MGVFIQKPKEMCDQMPSFGSLFFVFFLAQRKLTLPRNETFRKPSCDMLRMFGNLLSNELLFNVFCDPAFLSYVFLLK